MWGVTWTLLARGLGPWGPRRQLPGACGALRGWRCFSDDADRLPVVAIVGRPNVGKSALFNRLAGRRMALVQNTPDGHVTRDWREAPASLADLRFTVVDTSGMEPELGARAPRSIQARAAALTAGVLARADVTLLLMDGRAGVLPGDVELARWLRRLPPPHRVLLVANKCERRETSAAGLAESPRLGFGPAVAVAAEAGEGMADLYAGLQPLLDAVRGAAWGVVGSAGGPGVGGAEGAGVGGAEGAGVRGAEGADVDSAEGAGMGGAEGAGVGGAEGAGVGGAEGSGPPGLAAEGMQAPDDAAPAAEGGDAAAERTTERDSATKAQSPGSQASPLLRMAVVGLPNVGKSTLCNALLASERCLTGPEPGLTRDAVTARFSHEGQILELVDTAGWVRRTRLDAHDPDAGGVLTQRSLADSAAAMHSAQVVVLVVDGVRVSEHGEGLTHRELMLANDVILHGRALLIAANKMDALGREARAGVLGLLRRSLDRGLPAGASVRLLPMSALRADVAGLLPAVHEVYRLWNLRISTGRLNRFVAGLASSYTTGGGKDVGRIKYMLQAKGRPPTFVAWVSGSASMPSSTQNFLTKSLRAEFGLEGVPIRLKVRAKESRRPK
ncbi:hypothetical protein ACKKBG_A37700 [Auxenochlorella protothecoides x Auxenochlorella symbiontica]